MRCSSYFSVLVLFLGPAIAVQPGAGSLRSTGSPMARSSLLPLGLSTRGVGASKKAIKAKAKAKANVNAPSCSVTPQTHPETESPTHDNSQRLFLGYRGTTHKVAKMYRTTGLVGAEASGNPTSLGEGIYLTDNIHSAAWFAALRAISKYVIPAPIPQPIPDSDQPSICTIYANDRDHFIDRVPKVFLPPSGWPDAYRAQRERMPEILAQQTQWIWAHVPQLRSEVDGEVDTSAVVKFTNQDVVNVFPPESANQMMIPLAQVEHYSIGTCVDYNLGDPLPDFGMPTLLDPENTLDYRLKLVEWNIYGMVADEEAVW